MELHINVPEDAKWIIEKLNDSGYEAYVVGGCVRDSILGREPEDWDITTSALPMKIKELFTKTIDTGIQHGTVTIRRGGQSYETTTFRIDGIYEDSRHPKQVEFTSLLSEDLKRRDFTINAMAYSPETGLVDIFGGIDDINNKIVRCVGNADERFGEDALRMLRAVRFAGQLGFSIEEKTLKAIRAAAKSIENISVERIRTEITKLIMSSGPDRMMVAYETGLTKIFLPEWDEVVNNGKANDAIERINYINNRNGNEIMDERERKILCYASLMLDFNKKEVHKVLRRLKFDNYSCNKISKIVENSDISYETDTYHMRKQINAIGKDVMEALFVINEARSYEGLDEAKNLYKSIVDNNDPLFIKDLAVTGSDLIDVGIPEGESVGKALMYLLEKVLEKPEKNTKGNLMQIIFDEFVRK